MNEIDFFGLGLPPLFNVRVHSIAKVAAIREELRHLDLVRGAGSALRRHQSFEVLALPILPVGRFLCRGERCENQGQQLQQQRSRIRLHISELRKRTGDASCGSGLRGPYFLDQIVSDFLTFVRPIGP